MRAEAVRGTPTAVRPGTRGAFCLAAVCALLVAASCTPASDADTRPVIAVTIHPLKTIVARLTGPNVEVVTLLPPGMSPHAYDPVPSAARLSSRALLVASIDPEVDGWVASMSPERQWILNEASGSRDPHSWLSPDHVRNSVPDLASRLCSLIPDRCPDIMAQADEFSEELQALSLAGRHRLAGLACVVSAPFLSAFALNFGLDIRAVIAPTEGVEPTSQGMRAAIEAAREAGLVIGQTGLPDRAAALVAEAAGVPLVRVDPIGTAESAPTYAAFIDRIIATMEDQR